MPPQATHTSEQVQVSVVICTYNSQDGIRKTLESFRQIAVPPPSEWELILVDNNSSDGTRAVAEQFENVLPLRYCFEPEPGKCNALNHGIAHCRGSLVVITDHDVNVTANWLESYLKAAREHPEIAFFGGRVLPHWERHPPRWIRDNVSWLRINPHLDEGDRKKFMEPGTPPYFIGANMAFPRAIFDSGMRFEEHLGPRPDSPERGGEDIDVERRLLAQGKRGLYVPSSMVYHRHPANRMTEAYLRSYYAAEGICRGHFEKLPGAAWFGVPRYLWKELCLSALTYGFFRLTGPARVWLKAEIRMALAAGTIKGWRHRGSLRATGNGQ